MTIMAVTVIRVLVAVNDAWLLVLFYFNTGHDGSS
jgi:hypothetical protein